MTEMNEGCGVKSAAFIIRIINLFSYYVFVAGRNDSCFVPKEGLRSHGQLSGTGGFYGFGCDRLLYETGKGRSFCGAVISGFMADWCRRDYFVLENGIGFGNFRNALNFLEVTGILKVYDRRCDKQQD